jgi:uncharacterized protein YecE (DUF72 family)
MPTSDLLRIGTSGYQYNHWKPLFYPPRLRREEWFSYYAGVFDTVELNSTFYRLPEAAVFQRWHERAPAGFCYAVKYSRFGTHIMRLRDPDRHLQPFLANARLLGEQLGPILVQLPPSWVIDLPRLEQFLESVPVDLRWAFEFRHPSWLCAAVYRALRARGAALCIHDKVAEHPREVTAAWTYLRYHGGPEDGSYPPAWIEAEADRIRQLLAGGIAVFAYFNNDLHGHALANAADLAGLVTGRSNRLRGLQWFW